ncbi:MAG: hypothetical protein AAF936_08475 [Pseudomonadota bacterium]
MTNASKAMRSTGLTTEPIAGSRYCLRLRNGSGPPISVHGFTRRPDSLGLRIGVFCTRHLHVSSAPIVHYRGEALTGHGGNRQPDGFPNTDPSIYRSRIAASAWRRPSANSYRQLFD